MGGQSHDHYEGFTVSADTENPSRSWAGERVLAGFPAGVRGLYPRVA
jgi:hypothetical protein